MFNTYESQNFHKYNSGSLGHKKVFSSLVKRAALKINLIKSIIQDNKMKCLFQDFSKTKTQNLLSISKWNFQFWFIMLDGSLFKPCGARRVEDQSLCHPV